MSWMVLGGSSVREKGLLVDLSSSLALRAPEPRCVPELATASGRGLSPFPEPPAPGRCRLSLMLAMTQEGRDVAVKTGRRRSTPVAWEVGDQALFPMPSRWW